MLKNSGECILRRFSPGRARCIPFFLPLIFFKVLFAALFNHPSIHLFSVSYVTPEQLQF